VERRAKSGEQRAESKERRAKSGEQGARGDEERGREVSTDDPGVYFIFLPLAPQPVPRKSGTSYLRYGFGRQVVGRQNIESRTSYYYCAFSVPLRQSSIFNIKY